MRKQGVDPAEHDRLRVAFESHYEALVRLCTGLCLRQDLAEDIVQEAFVRIAPRLHRVADEAIGAYLRTSVVNLWKNRLRRLAVERRHASARREESLNPGPIVDQRDLIWGLLRELPDRQRACVVLRFYEDLSEREVARTLGCSIGTVKSQTNRALRTLERELAHEV
jgi:RNA polymerase sigma-70 factor (sigma-E family)